MLICGAGGHAKVILDCMKSTGISVHGIFGKKETLQELSGVRILDEYDENFYPDQDLIIATGDNWLRKMISLEVKHRFGKIVHQSAIITEDVIIEEGSVIIHNSVIQSSVVIGKHVIVNTSASVDHDCVFEDFVHISPNATICGGVQIGEGTLIGAGSVIIPKIKIGRWCVIGAGSVVIDNLPDYSLAVGNPARVVRKLEKHE